MPPEDRQFETPPGEAADRRMNEGQTRKTEGCRILFLGNSYNFMSAACLQTVVEMGYDIVVGFCDPFNEGAWQLFRKRLKSQGWGSVFAKAAYLLRCKTHIALRRMGIPVSGYVSLQELSHSLGVRTIRCADPNSPEFVKEVQRLEVDLIIVAAFSRILKQELIGAPRLTSINVHPSLLPRYRGPDPFYWVLANGETETGVTLHYIDEGIDSGDIILQRKLEIGPKDTEISLRDRSARVAAELLREGVPLMLKGMAQRLPQDHTAASYYSFAPKSVSVLERRGRKRKPRADQARKTASVQLFELDPLRDSRWRAFIEEHPAASVFHSVPWLAALHQTYGYQPVVYTTSPPGTALRNGLVFCKVESWLTGRRLVSLPFSDHCEPLVESVEELKGMLLQLQETRRAGDWKYIEVRPTDSGLSPALTMEGFQPSKRYYLHALDLRPAEQEVFQRFHKSSIQQRIRRAERIGMIHKAGRTDELMQEFCKLNLLARRRHQIPPQPEAWFHNLMKFMGDALEIHIASYNNTAVASIITLRFKDTVVYKYGGSDQAFHGYGPIPFLLWSAMQRAKSMAAKTFDLGRSDSFNEGLIQFKDRWGGERKVLSYWQYPAPTEKLSENESLRLRVAKQLIGVLPNAMLKVVGRLLYRHIG